MVCPQSSVNLASAEHTGLRGEQCPPEDTGKVTSQAQAGTLSILQ